MTKCIQLGDWLVTVSDDFDESEDSDDMFAVKALMRHNAGEITLEELDRELTKRLEGRAKS